jgi:hypothetical protein
MVDVAVWLPWANAAENAADMKIRAATIFPFPIITSLSSLPLIRDVHQGHRSKRTGRLGAILLSAPRKCLQAGLPNWDLDGRLTSLYLFGAELNDRRHLSETARHDEKTLSRWAEDVGIHYHVVPCRTLPLSSQTVHA